ncbi:MAG: maleylpyruvate isomerase family protein [Chloroflexi bacterium]|nr:maleylpyruvate isomerase family protein [Chloroflexota bacterium]
MRQPKPIIVTDLFSEILTEFLDLLSGLSTEDWDKPTTCSSWSVKDVVLHLLGGDIGILSRQRDGYSPTTHIESWEELVTLINGWNDAWVQAARRTSPRFLCDLSRFTGVQVCEYFQSLDPYVIGDAVSWAGPDPAPVWLDLAREYTERWHHQQHIRDAVGKPGLQQPRFFAPVLDAFVRALPHTYRETVAVDGTLVALTISGESGGRWFLLKQGERWNLYLDVSGKPHAEVVVDQDIAWRMFTKGLDKRAARDKIVITGDQSLGIRVLDMVSIIA